MQTCILGPTRAPPFSLSHSFAQFPLPKSSVFLNNHSETQLFQLSFFATNRPSSSKFCSQITPSKSVSFFEQDGSFPVEEELVDAKRSSKLDVQDLADKIKSLPNSRRIESIRKDVGFGTITQFNDLFMALVLTDELDLALKFYSNLTSYELVPDSWTYSILIHCYCKKNDPFEAKAILDQIMENGFQPNVTTFTQLINSFCKRGRLQMAFEVFGVMSKVKCQPTIITYNCLLKGLCYVGRVEEAYELLSHIKKSSRKPDIYTYTAVMDGFCKVGRSDEAFELLDEAIGMGLNPNVVTYNTIFNGYFKEGRPLEGFGLLKKMKERNCLPDHICYSTLLHGLLQWGKITEGLRVYKEMVEIGFEVDERMMNTLLRGLCRKSRKEKGLLKDAYQVFDKMSSRGCDIYPCAYELIIEAFCNGNEMDSALVNLNEMIRVGFSPRTITFNNVIRGLCVEGKIEAASWVLVSMYANGEKRIPSRVSFDILIDGLNQQRMALGASCMYSAALKRGVVPKGKPMEC